MSYLPNIQKPNFQLEEDVDLLVTLVHEDAEHGGDHVLPLVQQQHIVLCNSLQRGRPHLPHLKTGGVEHEVVGPGRKWPVPGHVVHLLLLLTRNLKSLSVDVVVEP